MKSVRDVLARLIEIGLFVLDGLEPGLKRVFAIPMDLNHLHGGAGDRLALQIQNPTFNRHVIGDQTQRSIGNKICVLFLKIRLRSHGG